MPRNGNFECASVIHKEIQIIIKNYQRFMTKTLISILLKLFLKGEKKGKHLDSFCRASITYDQSQTMIL